MNTENELVIRASIAIDKWIDENLNLSSGDLARVVIAELREDLNINKVITKEYKNASTATFRLHNQANT